MTESTHPDRPDADERATDAGGAGTTDRAWVERTGVVAVDGEPPWEALARLARVRHPRLAPLTRVAPVPGGAALTHLVPVGAVVLADLRAASPLRAGHVVTVVLAVLEAVESLHEAGLAHGALNAEAVLVAPDGGVVLARTGLGWLRAPGGPAPSADVDAAGELVRDLLGAGSGAAGLVIASLRASDPDPAARPTAAELHEQVGLAAPAAPLLDLLRPAPVRIDPRTPPPPVAVEAASTPHAAPVAAPPGAGRPPRSGAVPTRRRPARRRASGPGRSLLVVAALVAAGVVGVGAVRSGSGLAEASDPVGATSSAPPSVVPTTTTSAAPDTSPSATAPATSDALDLDRAAPHDAWVDVLTGLDTARTRALEHGSVADLTRVVDPQGGAWAADAALARRVAGSHALVRGGALVISEVRVVSADDASAELLVLDRRTAYEVTVDGRTQQVPERAARWWRVRLRHSAASWVVEDVEPVAAAVASEVATPVSTPRAP